jgi:hypothetical protein
MKAWVARTLLLCTILSGCAGGIATPSAAGTSGCELAPLAREISTETRAAISAARGGDKDRMVAASKAILERVDRIMGAMEAVDPEASLDPVLSSLLSVAYAANQAGFIFADAVPTTEDLDSFENTILGALDLSVEQVESVAESC